MKRVPLELQTSRTECGMACLAMVAGHYDRGIDLLTLRRRWPSHKHGLTLQAISVLAADLGLQSRGLRCEPEALRRLRVPAILHWDMNHFVVLVAVRGRHCIVHDPARGRLKLPWRDVDSHFTGVVLEVWPAPDFRPSTERAARLRLADLLPLARLARGEIFKILVVSVLLQVFVLAAPWHMQWTVDEAVLAGDEHLIGVLALAFGAVLLLRAWAHWLRGALVIHVGHMLSFQFASQLLSHLLRLPLSWFEQRHTGDVVSRFDALVPVRNLMTQGAAAMLVDGLMVALAIGLMLVYQPVLAALVVAVHLLLGIVQFCFVPRLKEIGLRTVVAQAAEQSHLLESVRAVHNVKIYAQENARERQWQKLHSVTLAHSMKLQHTQLGLASAAMLGGGAELLAVIYLGAHSVLAGTFTLGMLFAFVSYRGHFADRFRSLMEQFVGLQTLKVQLGRLAEIWGEQAEPGTGTVTLYEAPSGRAQNLSLHKVGFRHDEHGAYLLDQLDCVIASGEFVAITGPSGAGKTTLLKIMMGLIAPSQGQVVIGQRVLGPQRYAAYRSQIGCVLQQDGLFAGTVADNVALWHAPDRDRLRKVLQQVDIWSKLMRLPMGVRTQIGEIGSGLSSGEVQRLLLARALYQRPRYLFLDEGTANLDRQSASIIQSVIGQMDITRVIVTHDLEFASRADRVLTLLDGRLNEARPITRRAARNESAPSAG